MATSKHEVETRISQGGKVYKTELTLNWDGVSEAERLELAARTAIIGWQRLQRDAGKVETGKVTFKVRDMLDGKRPPRVVSVERLAADAGKMTPAQIAALVKELQAKVKGAKKVEQPGKVEHAEGHAEAPKAQAQAPQPLANPA